MAFLLVSKQYFEEAIRVWARSKVFSFKTYYELDTVLKTGNAIERHLLRHITSLVLDGGGTIIPEARRSMPALQHVTPPPWNEFSFHYYIDKTIWHDDFSDVELAQHEDIKPFLTFRGLRSFTIRWDDPHRDFKPEEKLRWERFQLQVKQLLDDVVLQPREKTEPTTPPWTLDQAFEEAKQAKEKCLRSSGFSEDQARLLAAPLSDDEVPETEKELLRLVLTRPRAMMAWHKDMKAQGKKLKKAEAELRELYQSAMPLD